MLSLKLLYMPHGENLESESRFVKQTGNLESYRNGEKAIIFKDIHACEQGAERQQEADHGRCEKARCISVVAGREAGAGPEEIVRTLGGASSDQLP